MQPIKRKRINLARSQSTMYQFDVVTHPTSDTAYPSILLRTGSGKRFLFGGVTEGTQRAVNQRKMRVSRLSTIFLTGSLNWNVVGGLPGLILTVSDQGNLNLTVANGNGILDYVIASWRNFVFRFGMNLSPKVLKTDDSLSDEGITVRAINLKGSSDSKSEILSENNTNKLRSIARKMFPLDVKANKPADLNEDDDAEIKHPSDPSNSDSYIHVKLPDFQKQSISTCYSIGFEPVRGKFQVEKAKQLNISDKRLFGKLARGEEITLEDGRVIKPGDVLSDPRSFQPVLIIDIPFNEFLQSAYETNWDENVALIFHLLGEEVEPFSDEYLKFIESFGPDCRHHISHPRYCPDSIVFEGGALVNLKLKTVLKDHFNLPISKGSEDLLPKKLNQNINTLLQGQSFVLECSSQGTQNKLEFNETLNNGPKDWESVFKNEVAPLNMKSKYTMEEVLDQTSVSNITINRDIPLKDQVETITLGTGSALPSKYRNVSSNLVRIPYDTGSELKYRSIILDAGENTIGTIKRNISKDMLETYFKELKMIYLSHLHADHHLGIVSIIHEWYKHNQDTDQVLYLVTPWQYNHFVNEWFKVERDPNVLNRIKYISCENFLVGKERNEIPQIEFDDFIPDQNTNSIEATKIPKRDFDSMRSLYHDLGIKKLATCRAHHCEWSYCCSITFKTTNDKDAEPDSFFKVSYSGDTRPNMHMFANVIGKRTDLLIHEATLENELKKEAKAKRHCTINEAISVSNEMEAKKLILTHFSQRYPKLPEISNNIIVNADFCYAFDGMIVRYDKIGEQQAVFDELQKAFRDEAEIEEEADQ